MERHDAIGHLWNKVAGFQEVRKDDDEDLSDWDKLEVGEMGCTSLSCTRQAGTVAGSGALSGSLGECPINV